MKIKFFVLILVLIVQPLNLAMAEEGVNTKCASAIVDWDNYDSTLKELKGAFQRESFSELETALDCLLAPNYGFPSGEPGATAVYKLFVFDVTGQEDVSRRLQHAESWKKFNPTSNYPYFVIAANFYLQAWQERGSGSGPGLAERQQRLFKENLSRAEQMIMDMDTEMRNMSITRALLIQVSWDRVMSGYGGINHPADVFNDAVSKWPYYYDLYRFMIYRMTPSWGGTWKKVDNFIKEYSDLIEEDGSSLYARLYDSAIIGHHNNPEDTLLSWPLMKKSLSDLVSIYPTDKHKILAASYACFYKEGELYRSYMSMLQPSSLPHGDIWIHGTSKYQCNRKFAGEK